MNTRPSLHSLIQIVYYRETVVCAYPILLNSLNGYERECLIKSDIMLAENMAQLLTGLITTLRSMDMTDATEALPDLDKGVAQVVSYSEALGVSVTYSKDLWKQDQWNTLQDMLQKNYSALTLLVEEHRSLAECLFDRV